MEGRGEGGRRGGGMFRDVERVTIVGILYFIFDRIDNSKEYRGIKKGGKKKKEKGRSRNEKIRTRNSERYARTNDDGS